MASVISASGLVATTPRHIQTFEGLDITSFRLAETITKLDKKTGNEEYDYTNWYTITCFDQLAINAADSIQKGHRVSVVGLLKIRDWDNGERAGTSVEVEAHAIGHDLNYGTSDFTRYTEAPEPVIHDCDCNRCDKRGS